MIDKLQMLIDKLRSFENKNIDSTNINKLGASDNNDIINKNKIENLDKIIESEYQDKTEIINQNISPINKEDYFFGPNRNEYKNVDISSIESTSFYKSPYFYIPALLIGISLCYLYSEVLIQMYHTWIDYIDLTDYEIVERVIDSPTADSTLSPLSFNIQYDTYFDLPPLDLIDLKDETTPKASIININKYVDHWDFN